MVFDAGWHSVKIVNARFEWFIIARKRQGNSGTLIGNQLQRNSPKKGINGLIGFTLAVSVFPKKAEKVIERDFFQISINSGEIGRLHIERSIIRRGEENI